MKITVKQLVEKQACVEQVKVFRKLFGASATVTLANCRKASKAGLDFNWAAQNLLPATALEAYQKAKAPALKAYQKAIATAWDSRRKAIATVLKAYEKATAPVLKAYQKATAPVLKAYEKAIATAWEDYRKAKATAFYEVIRYGGRE